MNAIVSASFTNETFSVSKDAYRQSISDPYSTQACHVADLDELLLETYWTREMKREVFEGKLGLSSSNYCELISNGCHQIPDISLHQLELFYGRFISRLRLEWLIFGNILKEVGVRDFN